MAWMRVLADFDFVPPEKPRSLVAYKKGYEGRCRRAALEQGLSIGRAEELPTPSNQAGHDDEATSAPNHGRTRKPEPGG